MADIAVGMVSSLARGWLSVYSTITKPAIPVGTPGEQLKAGGGHGSVVLSHSYHCHLSPAQACHCPRHNDCTFPTVYMEVWMTCSHSISALACLAGRNIRTALAQLQTRQL